MSAGPAFCGKVQYRSYKRARAALRGIIERGGADGEGHLKLDCYHCTYCNAWHIGHSLATVRRRHALQE